MVEVVEDSNLLDVQQGIICHQTNCIGVMGAGIARQIREKWPKVYDEYLKDCAFAKSDPRRLLGHVQDIAIKPGLIVANCYGQVLPGNGCMTDYDAWSTILDKLKDLSNYFNLDLHFPWMIGCGLAGGDWNIIFKKIQDAFSSTAMHVYVHRLSSLQTEQHLI